MRSRPQIGLLPGGRRLHLQDGPIDLVIGAFGSAAAIELAYRSAAQRFVTILDELCDELPALRSAVKPGVCGLRGPVALRMHGAVEPFAHDCFITPMAAVAGAVAEEVLTAMTAGMALDRAYVNNGGDIALYLSGNARFSIGMVDDPQKPCLFGNATIRAEDHVRGIATSGWRGRSFSLGVADAVTVLAATAAEADAAATVIANAVDLPGHPSVLRVAAQSIQPDSDLGDRPVTRRVGRLARGEIDTALAAGVACAERLAADGRIAGAALHLRGSTRAVGVPGGRATSARARMMEYADA